MIFLFSYECLCGKKFKTNKGLKIHQHKCPYKDRLEEKIIKPDVNQDIAHTKDISEMPITPPILDTSISEPISEIESPKEIMAYGQEILVKVPKNTIATSSEPLHLDLSISIPNIDIVIRDLRMVAEFQVKAMQRLERLDADRDLLNKIKMDIATYSENMINQQQKIQALMIIVLVLLVVIAYLIF